MVSLEVLASENEGEPPDFVRLWYPTAELSEYKLQELVLPDDSETSALRAEIKSGLFGLYVASKESRLVNPDALSLNDFNFG